MNGDYEQWSFTHPVSLGADCQVAYNIRRFYGVQYKSLFDWWFSPLSGLIKFLAEPDLPALFNKEYLSERPFYGGTEVFNSHYGFYYTHQFMKHSGNTGSGSELTEDWDTRQLSRFARVTDRIWEYFLGLDVPENRILFLRMWHEDGRPPLEDMHRLRKALSSVFKRAEFRILLLNYPHLAPQSMMLEPDILSNVYHSRHQFGSRAFLAEWDATLAQIPFRYEGEVADENAPVHAIDKLGLTAPDPSKHPASTSAVGAGAQTVTAANSTPDLSYVVAPAIQPKYSSVVFRSLKDGVDAPSLGFVSDVLRYAPNLIADPGDRSALSAYHLFCSSVIELSTSESLWKQIDDALDKKIFRPGEDLLLVDNSWQGEEFTPGPFVKLMAALQTRRIPPDTVAILTPCGNMPAMYEEWAEKEGLQQRPALYSYLAAGLGMRLFIDSMHGTDHEFDSRLEQTARELYGLYPRSYRFLCLNNTRTPWNMAQALLLREHFPEMSLVSYGRIREDQIDEWAGQASLWASPGPGSMEQRVAALAAQTPMILDIETGIPEQRERALFTFAPHLYWASALSVVTDCEMSSTGRLRFSEKVVKPLGLFHPFIVAGNCGTLRVLREYGFRTFAPFIDESYDEIKNGQERLRAIHREIRRVGALSDDDFVLGMRSVADSVIHNAYHSRYTLPRTFWLQINDLLHRLRANFALRSDAAEGTVRASPAAAGHPASTPGAAPAAAATIGDIVEITLDPAARSLRIVAGPKFNDIMDVFVHFHFYDPGSLTMRRSYEWPEGAESLLIDLPERPVLRIVAGQFVIGQRRTLWQATLITGDPPGAGHAA